VTYITNQIAGFCDQTFGNRSRGSVRETAMADHREAIMFKKMPDGYVFRAPNPWVLGRTRFYLVNEAEKTKLLAIITARSHAVFWVAFVGLIGASTAALAYFSGHTNPTTRDFVTMLALLPVWLYAAALVSGRPTARRLQPLLAGLPRTDQRITAADTRRAVRKTVSFRQYFMLGVSQAIMSVALILLALDKTEGGRISVFEDGGAFIFVFSAVVFVVSALSFLAAALDKARRKQQEPLAAANISFKSLLLPIFCLAVSIALLGFVVTNILRTSERHHQATLIQGRLDSLKARMDGSLIRSRQESLKVRTAANRARISELLARLNQATDKCEPATATDDPAQLESIKTCREFAGKEQVTIRGELDAARAESEAIQQDSSVLQKEIDAIRTQVDALQKEIKAIR
jgi:hypothetical protein